MIKKELLEAAEHLLVQRYNEKFSQFGEDPRSLGWGNREQQRHRFEIAVETVDFKNKSVLDIGCGLSDFYAFLVEKMLGIKSYIGVDINPGFVEWNKSKYPHNKYIATDFIKNTEPEEIADIGAMFGLVNFNFKSILNNLNYAKDFIAKAFDCVGYCLIVDMLSHHISGEYAKEDFVYYYSPEDMLKHCFSLTSNVILRHDYKPIPQKEFMLFLFK